jgi:dTDP-4-dehydrorhamnose reductase
MVRRYSISGLAVKALARTELDFESPDQLGAALARHEFNVLINTAGLTDVDYCEAHPELSQTVNADAAGALAVHCRDRGARMVQISTDYVFSGSEPGLLNEQATTAPINVYGRTKLDGERRVLEVLPDALVLRISWLFGLEKPSFPDRVIRQALERLDVSAIDDKWSCPTYADDLCDWILALLQQPEARGVFHLCNTGSCSWLEYGNEALAIANRLGLPLKTSTLRGHTMDGFARFLAERPRYTSLDTSRFTTVTGITPRRWERALEEYLRLRHSH